MAGCLDHISTGPTGPVTAVAFHFDSLSAQASAATQENRVAALDLVLRALADGAIPGILILSTGSTGKDTATYNTVGWGAATVNASGDSLTDSLMLFLGWRGANADTMVVIRSGDTRMSPQVQAELATLGLTSRIATSDSTDSLTSAGFVIGNTVAVADSGVVASGFGVIGAACAFLTVASVTNDATAAACNRELYTWVFGLRFSPSTRLGLATQSFSPGVVVRQ